MGSGVLSRMSDYRFFDFLTIAFAGLSCLILGLRKLVHVVRESLVNADLMLASAYKFYSG